MGEHGAFIWAAYGIAGIVIAGLTVHIWLDMRRQRALLADLEQRGAPRRRAARGSGDAEPGSAD